MIISKYKKTLIKIDSLLLKGNLYKIYVYISSFRIRYHAKYVLDYLILILKIFKLILSPLKKKQQNSHKNYFFNFKKRQLRLLTFWNNNFEHIIKSNLTGDIVECGVGNGETLSYILFNLIYKKNSFIDKKKYIGFDSFQGFPHPSIEDASPRNPKKGEWNHTDEKFVLGNLKKMGFTDKDLEYVSFIKGFFKDILNNNNYLTERIAILHLHCDLYESYKLSLEHFYPKVVEGGIIVFNGLDYSVEEFVGIRKVINDFFGSEVKNIKKCNISEKYFLIKNKL